MDNVSIYPFDDQHTDFVRSQTSLKSIKDSSFTTLFQFNLIVSRSSTIEALIYSIFMMSTMNLS